MNNLRIRIIGIVASIIIALIIVFGILSIEDMSAENKQTSIYNSLIFVIFPILVFAFSADIEKIKSRLIHGLLVITGIAFMTLIPILIIQFFANVGLYDKYFWVPILTMVFWGFNVYIGIKICRIAYKKFKKQASAE